MQFGTTISRDRMLSGLAPQQLIMDLAPSVVEASVPPVNEDAFGFYLSAMKEALTQLGRCLFKKYRENTSSS